MVGNVHLEHEVPIVVVDGFIAFCKRLGLCSLIAKINLFDEATLLPPSSPIAFRLIRAGKFIPDLNRAVRSCEEQE